MFENSGKDNINESMQGGFAYDKRELRVCLFVHKINVDEYNPLEQMSTVTFMLGVPATNEVGGMITLKNPARPPETFRTWAIKAIDKNEPREKFIERFWTYWNEAKGKVLALHGENISIMYEGRMLDGNGNIRRN